MWRWLRVLYLLAYWALVALLIALTIWAWRVAPGTLLGINWAWYAGVFLFVFAVVAFDATLELPMSPLPPEVPPAVELRRWLFWPLMGGVAGLVFLLLFLPLMFAVHGLRLLVAGKPWWMRRLVAPVGVLIVVGWVIGVFWFLAWLAEHPLLVRFRGWSSRFNPVTEEEIATMLKKVDLPAHRRKAWLERLRREGLTKPLVLEMLDDLQPYLAQERHPLRQGRYAQLVQQLNNWLERHP